MKWATALFPKKALAERVSDINSLPGDQVCFNHLNRTECHPPPPHTHLRGSHMQDWVGAVLVSDEGSPRPHGDKDWSGPPAICQPFADLLHDLWQCSAS